MATTISPGTGQGLVWTQQGPGTTPGFSAIDDRRAALDGAQEGVIASNSTEADGWACRQRTAGANNQVEIVANVACARVQGDSVTQQGLYTVAPHSALILETLSPADATYSRIDQVILEALDNVHDASGLNLARTRVLTGTPTSGATLDNRLGAVALPSNAMRLGDLLVPANGAGTVTLSNSQIRDRRLWARGGYVKLVRNANAAATDDYTTTNTTLTAIDAVNLNPRVECSGVPLTITLRGSWKNSTTSAGNQLEFRVDGSEVDGGVPFIVSISAGGENSDFAFSWDYVPSVGSHRFCPYWAVTTGAGTMYASAARPLQMSVYETVRQNAANNTLTSG